MGWGGECGEEKIQKRKPERLSWAGLGVLKMRKKEKAGRRCKMPFKYQSDICIVVELILLSFLQGNFNLLGNISTRKHRTPQPRSPPKNRQAKKNRSTCMPSH